LGRSPEAEWIFRTGWLFTNGVESGDGIETVGENTRQINAALGAQSNACDQVVTVLELMLGRNRDTEESGAKLNGAMRELVAEAIDLRAAVEHFTLEAGDA
jgi:methyl-accepting chemotaxis protein